MEQLYIESEYIQIMLEKLTENDSENEKNTKTDIENTLKIAYDTLKINIPYEEYKIFLINISDKYKNLKHTEENIVTYITLIDYFMLNKQDEIFDYIIEKYIIGKNKYYEKLHMYNSIDYYLTKKLEIENTINNRTLEYIVNINNGMTKLYSHLITQEILDKCLFLTKLNIPNNFNVTNVNHLNNLEELNISHISNRSGVRQEGITNLKLIKKLNASRNTNIKDVNHLLLLEELDISLTCGVCQKGISDLKLVKILNVCSNDRIYDVNHLSDLEKLNISCSVFSHSLFLKCGVKQEGIANLKLIKSLNVSNNDMITNVNHLSLLEELDISHECGVNQEGISDLKLIKILNIHCNIKITNINHLSNLEELDISDGHDDVYQGHIEKFVLVDTQNNGWISKLKLIKNK